jgi:putative ABC transport system permease protein
LALYGDFVNGLLMDFRYALRALRQAPVATAVAVLALALGIGLNTSSFIWVSTLVLHPLPYRGFERIMTLWETAPKLRADRGAVSAANFLDWRKEKRAFAQLAAYRPWDATLTGAAEPERIAACAVSSDFFTLLGMQPELGSGFSHEEENPGGVAIVSHGFWQRRLGANPAAVGRTISLDNRNFTVAGVMPDEFDYPLATDIWVPLVLTPQESGQRAIFNLAVLGRLAPGVTVEEARAAMGLVAGRLAREYPETNESRAVAVVPLRELTNQITDRFVLTMLGSATFVLLLACANVASLMLARATGRQRQFALEGALGASRFRIARRLLTESALIAVAGGVLGIWLAAWRLDVAKSQLPAELVRFVAGIRTIRIDAGVIAFTLAMSVLAALLCSLPAILLTVKRNASDDLAEALKEGGRGPSSGPARSRARSALVIAEVALALVLLVGAGLMVEAFQGMRAGNIGFNVKNLLTMKIALTESQYREPAQIRGFYDRALNGLRALPDVKAAAAAAELGAPDGFAIEGRPESRSAEMRPGVRPVTSGYFESMGLSIRQGRGITEQDGAESPRVVVLSESVVRHYWPAYPHGEDPIGSRIQLGSSQSPWLTVIGVSADVKDWFSGQPDPVAYIASVQAPQRAMTLLLRTAGDPLKAIGGARAAVRSVDRNPPLYDIKSMDQVLAWQTSGVEASASSMELFAVIALLLALTGIYALASYSVAQRTHEIGIRMALGARPGAVLKMVVGQSLRTTVVGLGIGLPAALVLTKVVSSLLSGVLPMDLRAVGAFTVLLGSAALAAAFFPARRAARVDPTVALRHE